jgi:hypothetical protein
MNVIQFEAEDKKHKKNLLELLEQMRGKVESGELEELVCAATAADGEVEIYVGSKDLIGAVGMFAVGQNILIQQGEGWVM